MSACGATPKQGVNIDGKIGHNINLTQVETNSLHRSNDHWYGEQYQRPTHEAHLQAKDGLIGTIV